MIEQAKRCESATSARNEWVALMLEIKKLDRDLYAQLVDEARKSVRDRSAVFE